MGIDLFGLGGSLSFNWSGWRAMLDLALAHGWTPQGTIAVAIEEWDGSLASEIALELLEKKHGRGGYSSNDGYIVTKADAMQLAHALENALNSLRDSSWNTEVDFSIDTPEKLKVCEHQFVQDLVQAMKAGRSVEDYFADSDSKGMPVAMIDSLIALCKGGPFRLL
jgi:hypothetical protein